MSRGTIDIYAFLHNKILSTGGKTIGLESSTNDYKEYAFGNNGIEFHKCRMMLAIQNESQLEHSKKYYPLEDEKLLSDQGNILLIGIWLGKNQFLLSKNIFYPIFCRNSKNYNN